MDQKEAKEFIYILDYISSTYCNGLMDGLCPCSDLLNTLYFVELIAFGG